MDISSTRNEEDIMFGPREDGERIFIFWPRGVENGHFYFYTGVLKDFRIQFPFSDFKVDLLTIPNITPSQLLPNGWGFIKAFKVVCEVINIAPTPGLFFSFFELKGADKGCWVSLKDYPAEASFKLIPPIIRGIKTSFSVSRVETDAQ